MKGVFRNGVFVDDEETPQMRNLEYDLSPEKMEKIWVGSDLKQRVFFKD